MKLFIDTAKLDEIKRWGFLIDGITTNPLILKQAGFTDPRAAWREIIRVKSEFTPKPISLSAEVFTDDPGEMIEQALSFVEELKYPGLAIKIPVNGIDGKDRYEVIQHLAAKGIAVNCTACVHWFQAYAAARAGAKFVSLLYRRSIDVGLDGLDMVRRTRTLLDEHGLKAEIIIGSIREKRDVLDTIDAGAHIVTVPPKFFPELAFHQKSSDTQREFLTAAGVLPEEKK